MGLKVGYMRTADLCPHPVRGFSATPRPEDLSPAVVTTHMSNRKKSSPGREPEGQIQSPRGHAHRAFRVPVVLP